MREFARWSCFAVVVGASAGAGLLQSTAVADDPYVPPVLFDASPEVVVEPLTDALSVFTTDNLSSALHSNLAHSIKSCVRRAGFEYVVPARVEGSEKRWQPSARTGYGIGRTLRGHVPETAEEVARSANLKYAKALPDRKKQIYLELVGLAPPAKPAAPGQAASCQAAAADRVLLPAMQAQETLGRRATVLSKAVEGDARVVQASRLWSECMAVEHYTFATPSEPAQQLARGLSEGNSTPDVADFLRREVDMAQADLKCRSDTHYTRTLEEVLNSKFDEAAIDRDLIRRAAGAEGGADTIGQGQK